MFDLIRIFRDREELVEKTFETAIGELHKRLDVAFETGGTFEQRLRAIITAQRFSSVGT